MYKTYLEWCGGQGWSRSDIMSGTAFGRKAAERYKKVKSHEGRMQYQGIGILADGWGNGPKPSVRTEGYRFDGGFEKKSSLGDTTRGSEFPENPPQPSVPSVLPVCGCDACPKPADAVTDCDGQAFIASADGWHCHRCHTAIAISEER